MRYLDSAEECVTVHIYDLFPSEKDFQDFCNYAHKVVCYKMHLDPDHHDTTVCTKINVYPNYEHPFVKEA